MTPQELKNSILQLAIQGKLVEQRPEEGTAQELYAQIQAEKQRLIKEGKIKKEKPLPEITENEKPFDIPDGWMWVRLGDISSYGQRKEKISASEITDNMWSLDLEDIEKESGKIVSFCKASERKITGDKVRFHKEQILYSKLRPYLKKVLVAPADGICSSEIVPFYLYGKQNLYYWVCVLKSPYVDSLINSVTYGVKMPRVGTETMLNLVVPLPPLAEQKSIVAKIEELLPLVDRYEQAWTKLEDFNRRFPEDMKKSILQQAIQGKLVEQRPEEGTAQELYEQIQIEKQRLIKEGKLKKEKPLPEITEEEKPFEIPEGWMWVRIGDVVSKITDGTHHSPPNSEDGEYKYITAKNIKDSGIDLKNITYVSKAIHDEIYSRCNPDKGDVLLIKDGATTGVVTVNNIEEPFSMLSSVALLKLTHGIFAWYLVYVLRSNLFYKNIRSQMKGTGITRITLKQIVPLAIPLPPFDEQKRIVERLEELLAVCERLKQK
ncbi:restriction endonuclease subunit S [Faecalibacterium sp. An122]|uniref:restriction endonuclease subunit S n=1 Tax=Faecalibacterium sp. An122 TaxID=1965551 RepID=UPI000B3841FC|nr:restriction endonuclease subunit S [Faecalibacterium sp. An122]OUQ36119.1 hypothetical protein B5E67_10865 [Faecalibacterium sp. An122]